MKVKIAELMVAKGEESKSNGLLFLRLLFY